MAPQAPPQQPPQQAQPPMQFGYQDDPFLVQGRAAAEASLAGAKGRGLEAKRRLLIQLGNPELAKQILGANDPTIAAMANDPMSTYAQIKKGYEGNVLQADEGYSANNLFYGTTRGKGLADLANQRQMQEAGALQAAQGGIEGINENLAGAEAAYREALLSGEQGAYQRAQDRALEFGIGPEPPQAPPGGEPPPGPPQAPPGQPHVQKLYQNVARQHVQRRQQRGHRQRQGGHRQARPRHGRQP